MNKLFNLTGLILKKHELGETDLLVSVLSEKGLRLDLIVKGAAAPRSRRKSHLELMNLIKGTVYQSPQKFYLQSIECQSSFSHLKEHLDRVLCCELLLEIIEKAVLPNDPHPEVYALLLETFKAENEENPHTFLPEIALIKLAHHLGFLPSFKHCSLCHKTLKQDNALFNHNSGTLSCQSCGHHHARHFPLKYRKALEFFRLASPNDCQKVKLCEEEIGQLKELIPQFFTSHLERPLKTLAIKMV